MLALTTTLLTLSPPPQNPVASPIQAVHETASRPATHGTGGVPRAWADVDGDGRLDVLVLQDFEPHLFRNTGERGFENACESLGALARTTVLAVAWADCNLDGRPDLFLAAGAGESRLLLNQGDWSFEDASSELGSLVEGSVRSAWVLDDDGDGHPDLHLETGSGSLLLRNLGAGSNGWDGFEVVELPGAKLSRPVGTAGAAGSLGTGISDGGRGMLGDPVPDGASNDGGGGAFDSGSTGGGGVTAGGVGGTAGRAASSALDRAPVGACSSSLRDIETGACLFASTVPTLGALFPLGPELFVDPQGQVGIGTLSPDASLEVVGNGTEALRLEQGALRINGSYGVLLEDSSLTPRSALSSLGGDDLTLGRGAWHSIQVGPSSALTVTDSGRIGVNNPQPSVPLDVQGDGAQAVRIEQGSLRVTGTSSLALDGSSQTPMSALTSFGGDRLYVGNGNWQSVEVGPASSLVVADSGRIGVNNPQPAAPLDVQGDGLEAIRIDQGSLRVMGSGRVALDGSGQSPLSALATFGGDELLIGADNWDALQIGPASSLTVASTGRIGVNQPQPQAALDVQGNGVEAIRIQQGSLRVMAGSGVTVDGSGQTPKMAVTSYGGDDLLIGADNWDAIQVGPAGSLTVEDTGRIGVNQPQPQAALDVQGNGVEAIRVEQGSLRVMAGSSVTVDGSGQTPMMAVTSYGGDDLLIGADNWDAIQVGPAGSLTVANTGRIGVNQPQPQAALDVQGDGVEAIRVEQGSLRVMAGSSLSLDGSGQNPMMAVTSYGGDDLLIGADNWDAIQVGPAGSLTVANTGRIGVNQPQPAASLDVQGDGIEAIRVQQGGLRVMADSSVMVDGSGQAPMSAMASFGSDDLLVGNDNWDAIHIGPAGSVTVTASGRLGIGDSSPSNILTVEQGSTTDPIADAWTTYSSRRWKENIQTLEGALGTLDELRGVRYTWKASGKPDVGFIAEEVGEVLPELVKFEDNGVDARSVDYARMTAVLVQAVKEQQEMIDALRADVVRLEQAVQGRGSEDRTTTSDLTDRSGTASHR